MRPHRTVLVLLLSLSTLTFAGHAHAGGMNLSWDDCGAFGTLQKNFACDTNTGFNQLYVSAISPAPMPQLNSMYLVLDLQTNAPALGAWWDFTQTSGCRSTALSGDFNFAAGPFSCVDPWLGQASGGLNYTYQFGGLPYYARLQAVCAVPTPVSSDGVSEYYLAAIVIKNIRTVGPGSCAGCGDGVCLHLVSVRMTQPVGQPTYVITNPIARSYAVWQPGGFNLVDPYTLGVDCPAATPARNSTWGSVKALYR